MQGELVTADWTALLRGGGRDTVATLSGLKAVIGAAHRLAWRGPDVHGDRARAAGWVEEAIDALDASLPGLAAILDWWLVAALERAPRGRAWSIDRDVGAPAGDALKRILSLDGGLREIRRPARFRELQEELQSLTRRNPGKIGGDKEIYRQAHDECHRLMRAATEGGTPPADLRLLRADRTEIERWASEGPAARAVVTGTPVWNTLVRNLEVRRDLLQSMVDSWPRPDHKETTLAAGWEAAVREAAADGSDVAIALVQDALPEPPPRPLLDPKSVRPLLVAVAKDLQVPPVFRLAREAWSDSPDNRPNWLAKYAAEVDALSASVQDRAGYYVGEAKEALTEAAQHAAAGELAEARAWLKSAEDEHARALRGATFERQRTRTRELAAELLALGQRVPPETDAGWADAVDAAWQDARARIRRGLEILDHDTRAFAEHETARLREIVAEGLHAVDRQQLVRGATATESARAEIAVIRARDDARLGPELAAVRNRAMQLDQPEPFLRAVERLAHRRDKELPWAETANALGTALGQLERGIVPCAVCAEPVPGRPVRVAWLLGGVETSGDEARALTPRIRGLRLAAAPATGAEILGTWGELLDRPGDDADRVFLREGEDVTGPWRVRGGRASPESAWGAVAVLEAGAFRSYFGTLPAYPGRSLVPQPPDLDEMIRAGGTLRDALGEDALGAWLAAAVDGAPPPDAIARWLERQVDAVPDAIRAARLSRMTALLATSRHLDAARRAAVEAWLASEAGTSALDAEIKRAAGGRLAEVTAEVARRRAELDAELSGARDALDAVRADLAAADELLADRKIRLLGAVLGGAQPAAPRPASEVVQPLRSAPFQPSAPADAATLVREIAGSTWDPLDVANLLLSIATGRWTLLAGLPGVGKSTFVRSVLARLGHGPTTERYLELVVRRDWQDDAALFGFWHPTDRAWVPSSEGFVEQLLRAADDAARGPGGLWPVVVEELNLASPEYYLARPISAFEAAIPEVRLYDAGLAPANRERYPAVFRVPDSVRMIGTVNVDDTVERLSPRFLSRASVLWVEPRMDASPWRPEDDGARFAVPWAALPATLDRSEAPLGKIEDLIRFLHDLRVPGAPTARTRRAIGRYLSASVGLLPRSDAEDLQVLQRVLPPIRGTGPRWRMILDRLADLLLKHGWRRSADRTRLLRERGEEVGDWYDFFHG